MKNTSKKLNRIIGAIVLFLAAVFLLTGCFRNPPASSPANADRKIEVTEDGIYTSKDEVAAYIHKYGTVPSNFLTKSKAKKLGWDPSHHTVDEVLPGYSIGGGGFANAEGLLPEAPGREYFECDIDYHGGKRNAKRIVYSNDGLIFYTDDHYESFERLY